MQSDSSGAASPRVIVIGNEKGGSGKSTTAMHLIVALLYAGQRVAALDLDVRQATLNRYLENRNSFIERSGMALPVPTVRVAEAMNDAAAATGHVADLVAMLSADADVVVIDTPGSDSALCRVGHSWADLLITPLNDSFVDLDGLARVDPDSGAILRPGRYAEMVFEQKIVRARRGVRRALDWVALLNRLGQFETRNRQALDRSLQTLGRRIGFRIAPGLSERVIFRELFLDGLTLQDLRRAGLGTRLSLSHVAARQELRGLLQSAGLPNTGL